VCSHLVWAPNVNLGFDDWAKPARDDALGKLKLLHNDSLDAGRVGLCDPRPHLCAEHAEGVRTGHRLFEACVTMATSVERNEVVLVHE
jgi:hypothetical protein